MPYDSTAYAEESKSSSNASSLPHCLKCHVGLDAAWKSYCKSCYSSIDESDRQLALVAARTRKPPSTKRAPSQSSSSAPKRPKTQSIPIPVGASPVSGRPEPSLLARASNSGKQSRLSANAAAIESLRREASPSGTGREVSNTTVSRFTHDSVDRPYKTWLGTYYANDDEQLAYTTTGVIPSIVRLDYKREDVSCWRGQWEWGGDSDKSGRLHIQFAVTFRDNVRPPQARRILGGEHGPFTGFLSPAYSSGCWDYVSKKESRVQTIPGYGDLRGELGNRSDLDVLYEAIANGLPLWEIMSRFPRQYMRNATAVGKLCAMHDRPRPYVDATVEIWFGVTGSGKSTKAYEENPQAYRKTIPGKWWEGYKGEETVIFEEFNPQEDKELRLPELLKILDKFPYQVEIKGASLQLRAHKFIFTTNIDPREWYPGHPQMPALCRRVTGVRHFRVSFADRVELGLTEEQAVEYYPGMEALEGIGQFRL